MSNSSLKALGNERSFNAPLHFFSFQFYKGRCGSLIILCCELVLCPASKGKKPFLSFHYAIVATFYTCFSFGAITLYCSLHLFISSLLITHCFTVIKYAAQTKARYPDSVWAIPSRLASSNSMQAPEEPMARWWGHFRDIFSLP